MKFAQNIQKFWKPILALLGIAGATSSAGTILLLLHLNLLNNNVIGSHNPTVTNGQNTSGNPVQGNLNATGQNNQIDNSINKTGSVIFYSTEIGAITSSITMIDRSTTNITTNITEINHVVANIQEEVKRLRIESPNSSNSSSLIVISNDVDRITKLTNQIDQTSGNVNHQVLNIKKVTGALINRSSPSTTGAPSTSTSPEKKHQSNISSTENQSRIEKSNNQSGALSHSEDVIESETAAASNCAAVPEPSSVVGLLLALSGVVSVGYRKWSRSRIR